jgi:hypothetical protein
MTAPWSLRWVEKVMFVFPRSVGTTGAFVKHN